MHDFLCAVTKMTKPVGTVSLEQYDASIRAAAISELRGLLNNGLYSLVRALNRPLLLMPVPVKGWWYAVTPQGLRMLDANRVNTPNLGASVDVLSTWEMYSVSADLSTVFTIIVGLNGNNPVVAYSRVYETIWRFAIEVPHKSFVARTRRSSR